MLRSRPLGSDLRLLAVLLLFTGLAYSGEPGVVKDIEPGPASSSPFNLTVLGDRLLFWTYVSAYPDYHATLWSSDGTEAGTTVVKAFDANHGYSYYPTLLGDVVLFWDYDSAGSYRLWRTDGTEGGTYLLAEPDPSSSYGLLPYYRTQLGNVLLFWAYGATSYMLWRTDGTVAGTYPLGITNSPYQGTQLGNVLLFWGYDATTGYELWRTDGTVAGTYFLADTDPTGIYGYPNSLTQLGDKLTFWSYRYFPATQKHEYELWGTDGTVAGTQALLGAGLGNQIPESVRLGDALLMWIKNPASGPYSLWRTDGTAAGTALLKNLGLTSTSSRSLLGDTLLFWAYDATNGYTLWKTDGSVAGTSLVKDTDPAGNYGNPAYPTQLGSVLLFWSYSLTDGYTLWRTDGTPAGTLLLKDTDPTGYYGYPTSPTQLGNTLLFWSYNFNPSTYAYDYELWSTDGTTTGTVLVKTGFPYGVSTVTPVGGLLLFWSLRYDPSTYTYDRALWRTDGTTAGTFPVKGGFQSNPSATRQLGSLLLFWMSGGPDGYTLWRTDGTSAGTYFLADTDPTGARGTPSDFTQLGDVLLFWSRSAADNWTFWRTDGSPGGTYLLCDPGAAGTALYFSTLPLVGNMIHFTVQGNSALGGAISVWKTDGTAAGTALLEADSIVYPSNAAFLGNVLLFWTYDYSSFGGYSMWRADGTASGTFLLVSGLSSVGGYFHPARNTLIYNTYAAATGYSLWQTDGTTDGTALLKDGYSYTPGFFTFANDVVFFQATAPATGAELWRLDGEQRPSDPPAPPAFTKPTAPATDSSFTWAAGKMLSFELSAFDPNAGDTVTLSARSIPAGAALSPGLPQQGNPVSTLFSWTPGTGDAGEHVVEFVASDGTHEVTYRITVTVSVDADGDGLLDLWETPAPAGDGGYTLDGVFVDLVAMGANPRRKDVFVEIDYMADAARSQMPRQSAIDRIVAMFAGAPVSNPDGSTGITLHVRIDDAVPWSDLLGTTGGAGYDWTAFDAIKETCFDRSLRPSTHYCLFAYKLQGGYSGLSRGVGAADFIVSLGGLPTTFNREWAETGTFGHELGHNMGLMHGGNDDLRQKPNYLSIMNLAFQLRGMRRYGADGYFDFSREAMPDLDEYNLDETRPLTPVISGLQTTFWKLTQRWSGTLPCTVDWDVSGSMTAGVRADINNDGRGDLLKGWNDWANLNFTGGSLGAGVILPEPETSPIVEELDEVEILQIKPAAPVGVSVRAGTGSMRVVWNTCGEGLTYNIYRWVGEGAPVKIGSADRALYTDTTVTKGVTYKYAVTVINGPESDLSATVSALAR